jgi:hypothetical protein
MCVSSFMRAVLYVASSGGVVPYRYIPIYIGRHDYRPVYRHAQRILRSVLLSRLQTQETHHEMQSQMHFAYIDIILFMAYRTSEVRFTYIP